MEQQAEKFDTVNWPMHAKSPMNISETLEGDGYETPT
jgi:hypothetical protein